MNCLNCIILEVGVICYAICILEVCSVYLLFIIFSFLYIIQANMANIVS